MVGLASGSLLADSQPGSFGLGWGSAAAWRSSILIIWTGWTLEVACHDDSTINIIMLIIIIIMLANRPYSLLNLIRPLPAYLVRCHIADGAMCLHALELVETPVEVVQNVNSQLFRRIVYESTKICRQLQNATISRAEYTAVAIAGRTLIQRSIN